MDASSLQLHHKQLPPTYSINTEEISQFLTAIQRLKVFGEDLSSQGERRNRSWATALKEAQMALCTLEKVVRSYERASFYGGQFGTISRELPLQEDEGTPHLSDREQEVLRLLAAGLSDDDIASQLVISVGTTRTHIRSIYRKLGVHNRVQAVRYWQIQ